MPRRTAEQLTDLARDAIAAGAPWSDLQAVFRDAVVPTEAAEKALTSVEGSVDHEARAVDKGALTALRDELARCELRDAGTIEASRARLQEAVADCRRKSTAVAVDTDSTRGLTRTFWTSPGAAEIGADAGDRGHVRLVAVTCAQVGDGNRQLNFVIHEVDDPKIEFDALMGDSRVADCLAACAEEPGDPERRAAAVAALSGQKRAAEDWTEVCARPGAAREGRGSARLDGTVALVRSRSVQVGDHCSQENRIVHTVSPTLAAHVLLDNPAVVDGLIDVASRPNDANAAQRFERAVETALCTDLAESTAPRTGYATVYRPSAAGRTLQVEEAIGVSVGKRASSKATFAQKAHIGHRVQRSIGRLTSRTAAVRRATERAARNDRSLTVPVDTNPTERDSAAEM
jgi:hypothetical protein